MKRLVTTAALLGVVLAAAHVRAAGYDTPILYTARHIGMGGTAIGYVNEPSAMFHNPAGLAHTRFIDVTADFSPILGFITASPAFDDQNEGSAPAFAPFFLLGGAFRVHDLVTLGIGVYPVASAGAGYEYTNKTGVAIEDSTRIAFIEIAPGISFNIPGNVRLGVSYRITTLSFQRIQKNATGDGGAMFDMDMSGWSFLGFKVGLQWTPPWTPWLQVGFVYRHKTTTTVKADTATVVLQEWNDTEMDFILPSSFGFGLRADFDSFGVPLGVAFDVQYTLQSQNERASIKAVSKTEGAAPLDIPNIYKWQDGITLRTGLEYKFLTDYRARIGYVWDSPVSNKYYPSAFGTPPDMTHSLTFGLGGQWPVFEAGMVEVNLAYVYRFGTASVPGAAERAGQDLETCLACSRGGDYAITMHGFYVDTTLRF